MTYAFFLFSATGCSSQKTSMLLQTVWDPGSTEERENWCASERSVLIQWYTCGEWSYRVDNSSVFEWSKVSMVQVVIVQPAQIIDKLHLAWSM